MNYTPLQVKTSYSILSSLNDIKKLVSLAAEYGYKNLAITDESNMFGVMEFYLECKKNNIKPIIGIELTYDNTILLLYSKNINGYKCVLLNTKKYANAEPKDKKPIVSTKYIIIPNYNDNVEELEKWIQASVDCGARSLAIDIEHKWFDIQRQKRALPDRARFMLQYVARRAKELNLLLLYYNSAQVFIENELDYLNYDFIPVSYGPDKQNTVEEYADYMS